MNASPQRQEFYRRLEEKHAAPLWEVLGDLVSPQPRPTAAPALWRYQEMRALLLEAGRLITAQEAERRVLVLENPAMPGSSLITQSLYAGLQLVEPGEATSVHRHAAAALRFVIESENAYTAVNGERTIMHPGDFVITPSWTYHDHGNPGDTPAIWLDGLDVPIVNMLGASFAEGDPRETPAPDQLPTDVVHFPYAPIREALERLYRDGAVHPCHGAKLQYGYPMPTMGAFLQLLPAGFRGATYRSTDAGVYCVAEGAGRSKIGDMDFDWQKNDVFVVPSWSPISHQVEDQAVLFSFSDRPVQKALELWREEIVRP